MLFNKILSHLVSSSLDSSLSSCNSSTSQRKRRVRFVISQFSYVEPPVYHPPLDPHDLYYSKHDFAQIKLETALTLQLMQAKDPRWLQDEKVFCSRGVEELSPATLKARCDSTTQILQAILLEQTRQHQCGILDIEVLAEISRQLSARDVVRAHHQGLRDALVAQEILKGKQEGMADQECSEPTKYMSSSQVDYLPHSYCHIKRDSFFTVSTMMLTDYDEDDSDEDDDNEDGASSFQKLSKEDLERERHAVLLDNARPFSSFQRLFQSKSCWCQ